MRSAPRKTEIENAAANPGIWGLLGSGMAFFNDVLQTLKTHRVLALLWGICVLFLFFVVATFALAGELLKQTRLDIEGVAERTGFASPRQFRRAWGRYHARPPSQARTAA